MITLYDWSNTSPTKSLSPFVLKVRVALNYKSIPHKTTYIPFASIPSLSESLGLEPNPLSRTEDGATMYTVPILVDPSTNTTISDSLRILAYLDATYPPSPPLSPILPSTGDSAALLVLAFDQLILTSIMMPLYPLLAPHIARALPDEPSRAMYSARVEAAIGVPIDVFLAPENAPMREGLWGKVKEGFNALDALVLKSKHLQVGKGLGEASTAGDDMREDPWLCGKELTAPDLSLAATLLPIPAVLGEDDPHWKDLCGTWNGGRWGRFCEAVKPFAVVY